MKKLFTLFIILMICGSAISQDRWVLTPQQTPKPPFSKGVRLPVVYQTWDNTNTQTMVYMTPAGVMAVGPNFRVLPNSNQQDEIILTSNPLFPMLLFGSANTTVGTTYSQGVYVSTNGGLNWYGTDIMPNCPVGASDPAPAIDKNGVFVFTTLNTSGSVSMIGLYSTNYGVNWSTPFTIPGGSPSDKNMTATDDVPSSSYYGRSYTVWTKWTSPYPIMISYTTNSGVSWSTGLQINSPSATSQGCDVVVGPNPAGVVYVCWSRQSGVSTAVGFAKSTNGGTSFATVNETAFSVGGMRSNSFNGWNIRVNDFPRIACDKSGGPRNGWLYIVDCEKNLSPAGTDEDIILHRSTDGGTTWSSGIRVNQDLLNNGKKQFFPCVAVDPNGGVNVLYYDNRNYPSVGDSCETYMSRSVDGGTTWTDILVSDHRWKPAPEPGLAPYAGDYIGITCGNGKIWPFWFDNKSGSFQAWTCAIDLGPSIAHTPLGNTEQITGNRVVACTITPAGSGINPSTAKLVYRYNGGSWINVNLVNSSGITWQANLGLLGAGTYNYYLTATDSLSRTATAPAGAPANYYSFLASTDTVKPVITHTPIGPTPKVAWPINVTATITDNIGIDSGWVKWRKGNVGTVKQFKLNNTSGSTYSAPFNSVNSDVMPGDTIFYRIFAQDNSTNHNRDSTALYNFLIINQATITIGTGTTSSNFPYTTYWMDGRTQYLYTAAEFGNLSASIVQIGFDVLTVSSQVMNGFKISMQNTTMTSLTGFVTTGWTTCYNTPYTVPGTGWQMITLSSPFAYTGAAGNNLLVEVCYNNSSYTSYSTVNSSSATGMYWGRYGDLSSGDGCATTTWSSSTAPPGRANTRFVVNPVLGTGNNGTEIPKTYSMSQNYPNPFNPITQIKYDIPKQGLVTLKVFDVLGREVAKLVNDVKAPGSYVVDFDASKFASGTYFYRLEAGTFSDVKKMLLIK
jgi:hypothetical protein